MMTYFESADHTGDLVGETCRLFGTRKKEHKDESIRKKSDKFTRASRKESLNLDFDSAVAEHAVMENHLIDWDNCNILANDGTRNTRWIRESIWIRRKSNKDMHRHLMNGDEGAYRLSHLYDQLIQNTSSSCE